MSRGAKTPRFTFYDMFAGIGAFHIAAVKHGGVCTGACDIDRFARQTYQANFGMLPAGDVRGIERLPSLTDVLFAGFPCPTFSIAGKSKLGSLGRAHGFADVERGQLIFEVARIVEASRPRPRVIVLENVKHLLRHDSGRTLDRILSMFEDLGYGSTYRLLDSRNFGSPQQRQRVFIALFRGGIPRDFEWPEGSGQAARPLRDFLERNFDPKYVLDPGTWATLKRHKKNHAARGNGFGYRLIDPDDDQATCPTISARYHKDGAEALIKVPGSTRPRRLTPREVANIMMFPKDFRIVVSDTQAYRQFGNSIVVSVAEAVVRAVVDAEFPKDGGRPKDRLKGVRLVPQAKADPQLALQLR